MHSRSHTADSHVNRIHYLHLLVMTVVSFIAMYVLMYAMVDVIGNVYPNLNQLYMAGMMTAPMVVIELTLMGAMYWNKKANALIIGASVIALLVFFIAIRQQAAISDKQFLKSMIPHHAGAILMCGKAPVHDADIQKLCKSIISGQQREIDQMKAKLRELDR
jgi:uncharacterized protein (DUF305 family)